MNRMKNSVSTFSRLISPKSHDDFFQNYWEKDSLYLERQNCLFYEDVLTVDALDKYFQNQHISPSFLSIQKDQKLCPPEQWTQVVQKVSNNSPERIIKIKNVFDLFNNGATIIINSGEMAIPSLTELSRKLESEFKCPVQANVYLTPPDSQGFAPHFDSHNVFVLQIYGEKTWNLYDIPIPYPTKVTPVESSIYLERKPNQTVKLTPGDLLYVPRGMVHWAKSEKTTSIHVTIGPMVKSKSQMLKLLAKKAEDDASFRQLLPIGLNKAVDDLQKLQQLISESDFNEINHANFLQEQRPDIRGLFTDLLQTDSLTADSIVSIRPALNFSLDKTDEWLMVSFEGNEIALPLFLENTITEMVSNNQFKISEIEGIPNNKAKIALVSKFVRAGFLRIILI